MARSRIRGAYQRPVKTPLFLIVATVFLLLLSITVVLFVTWINSAVLNQIAALDPQIPVSGKSTLPPVESLTLPAPSATTAAPVPTLTPTLTLRLPVGQAERSSTAPVVTPILWNGAERVTILIMGIDSRDWSQGEDIPRTDTMILLTIDPTTKKAGILSIPRDMWVAIPGFGEHKINTAYRWGELYEFPGGGSGLAMRTVRNVIGVPVQYFVLVDFNAFVALIDAMGGLDMHIREEILIDPVGPGNTRLLEPGVQTLSGAEVLAYARNRSTEYDDFDRSKRQQELILAIRSQVLTFNMLPALMAEAPALFARLSSGIRTNLTLDEMIGLAWLAAGVPEENIERSVFDMHKDFNYSTAETAEGVLDILLLKPERMRLLREEMFPTR